MRPLLKVSLSKELQDARYCAAMGIDILSFKIGTNQPDALSFIQVGEMIKWLEVPAICIETNAASWTQVVTFARLHARVQYISLPFEEWTSAHVHPSVRVVLRVDSLLENPISAIKTKAEEGFFFEMDEKYFVPEFASFSFLCSSHPFTPPPYGYSFREEFSGTQGLDYDKIEEWLGFLSSSPRL